MSEDRFNVLKFTITQKDIDELISEFVEDLLHYPVEDVIKKWKKRLPDATGREEKAK